MFRRVMIKHEPPCIGLDSSHDLRMPRQQGAKGRVTAPAGRENWNNAGVPCWCMRCNQNPRKYNLHMKNKCACCLITPTGRNEMYRHGDIALRRLVGQRCSRVTHTHKHDQQRLSLSEWRCRVHNQASLSSLGFFNSLLPFFSFSPLFSRYLQHNRTIKGRRGGWEGKRERKGNYTLRAATTTTSVAVAAAVAIIFDRLTFIDIICQ